MTPFFAGRWPRVIASASRRTALGLGLLLAFAAVQAAYAQGAVARIAFIGDSMSDGIWGGLVRMTSTDPCLKGHFELGRFGNNGTGLTRPDKYDWPDELKKIIAKFHPDLLVASMGLNDRQFLVDVDAGRAHVEFGTPEWTAKYAEQVTRVLKEASEVRAGLLWVGIPILRDAAANADALEKNQIYSGAISSLGARNVRYVAPWQLNPGGPEAYKSIGPGRGGSVVALRAPDGIHFTAAGYDLLADYLYPKIVQNLQDNQIQVPQACGR
jgi:hypothetical protein